MYRTLIAIPAKDEALTIGAVIEGVVCAAPGADVIVIDDGSADETSRRAESLGAVAVRHACSLGYGRAMQTALKYALARGHDLLVTLDADGQHDPADLPGLLETFEQQGLDLCIGSRHSASRTYAGTPLGRQIGMRAFSALTRLLTGRRIYDTTSGYKVFRATVFAPLVRWQFVDFHAEALVYLLRLGYRVGEHPVVMREREHGHSMYGLLSTLKYPMKTLLMVALGLMQAEIERRRAT